MSERFHSYLKQCGTLQRPHSGRSLYEHLISTEVILRRWGCAEDTAIAGLFHSIYGTSAYHRVSLDLHSRDTLAALIGAEAERLIYLFSACTRPSGLFGSIESGGFVSRLDGQFLKVDEAHLEALFEIECANLMEQGSRSVFFRMLLDAVEAGLIDIRHSVMIEISAYAVAAQI
jgi:hypothetical protein